MSTQWIKAIARDEVPEEDVIAVQAGGREIALYGVDGEVYATANLCTHGNARLCDGFLMGHESNARCTRGVSMCATGARSVRRCATTWPPIRSGSRTAWCSWRCRTVVQTARRKASLAAAMPMAAVTVTTEP